MGTNPENHLLTSYIQKSVVELVEPLEEMLLIAWNPEEELPNGLSTLGLTLVCLGLQIGMADDTLTINEASLIREIGDGFAIDTEFLSVEQLEESRKELREKEEFSSIKVPPTIGFYEAYDSTRGTSFADKARSMYFRFANAIIKADGKVTPKGESILREISDLLFCVQPVGGENIDNSLIPISTSNQEENIPLEELLTNLTSLIGLERVKRDVTELVNFIKVQQMRQSRGMNTIPISRHLVFFGNPGTGKTTIARLLAKIYKSLGIVSKGHLVETDRSGLVAGYVGQTALKVKDIVTEALGGILFIDEAYSLVGEDRDYGREAIETLIKLMEDNRNDLIVVVAGYTDKMRKFLDSNPGLKSRFNKYLFFEDYIPNQLAEIFSLFCLNAGFKLTSEADKKVLTIFQVLFDMRDESFGNARLARNIFERTVNNQANRIIAILNVTEENLTTIESADIPGEIEINSLDVSKTITMTRNISIKNYDRRTHLAEILTRDPKNVDAWIEMSTLVDKPDQVIDCLQRARKLDPSNKTVMERLSNFQR